MNNNFKHCYVYTTGFFRSKFTFFETSTVTGLHLALEKKIRERFAYILLERKENFDKAFLFAFHSHTYLIATNIFFMKSDYIILTVGTYWSNTSTRLKN